MKCLVIYDSLQGNTKLIAESVAQGISKDTKALQASEATTKELKGIDLLVIGSPTLGGRPTDAVRIFIKSIADQAPGMSVATFDTRIKVKFAKMFGYAAERMAVQFRGYGAKVIAPPEGFIVLGRSGPLAEGEIKRARDWASHLLHK